MTNFTTVSQQLASAGATMEVTDAVSLATAVSRLLEDQKSRKAAIEAAAEVARSNATVVDHVLDELKPFLDALPAGNSDAHP